MATIDLTAARLREMLNYHPATGIFTSRVQVDETKFNEVDVSKKLPKGYLYISILGRSYLAHRLAWLYVYGEWPVEQIDHINGMRADNRIENIRPATASENGQNRQKRSDNTSGFTGVRPHQGSWRADIKLNGKYQFIGSFQTPELAYAAYLSAKSTVHKFQPTPRNLVGASTPIAIKTKP